MPVNIGTISTQDKEGMKFVDAGTAGTAFAVRVSNLSGGDVGASNVDGSTFSQGTTSGNLSMGVYTSSPQTLTNGKVGAIAVDVNRNIQTHEQYGPSYEDNVNGVAKVEHRFSYTNMIAAATTNIKGTATGVLHSIVINTPIAGDSITAFDSANGTAATTIGRILVPGTTLSQGPMTAIYDVSYNNGLVVSHTGTSDLTVTWR